MAGLVVVAAFPAAAASASAAGRPDLAVGSVRVSGVAVTPGSCTQTACAVRLTLSARVLARGARRAGASRLGVFVSRDARRDRADLRAGGTAVRAIRGGHGRDVRITVTATGAPIGALRVIVCADVGARVRERRETNNCRASRPFTVSAPSGPTGTGAPADTPCQAPAWRRDLCAEVTAAMTGRAFLDMADAVTFVLLFQHHRTGQAIPPSIAGGLIEPLRQAWDPVRGQQGITTYRVSGFLDFWVYSSYAGVDWARYPQGMDTRAEFDSWWQTYAIVQNTARQNAINHRLNAIVESEAAWRKAMDDLKAYDLKLITAQQYSDATVFAHRTLEDAQTALLKAENAVKGPP